jgi:transcriptional regulator with XRE-family HTH domain
MSKSGQSILRGAHQSLAYVKGAREGFVAHVPEEIDVVAIRTRLGLSQDEFATRFGFKLDALQNWEQGRRRPDGAARAFLRVIEREPEAVARALANHQPAMANAGTAESNDTKNDVGERPPNSARERDLDNFLLEELSASPSFRDWFLKQLTHCLDVPSYADVKVGKNPKREVASGQTDIHLALLDQAGHQLGRVLIESKVAGGFQPNQPARYAEEIKAARMSIGHRRAAAVLIAPQTNKAVFDHPCFDVSIRLEAVRDHLQARIPTLDADNPLAAELRERLKARAELLDALAGKQNYNGSWTPSPIPERLDFFEQYRSLAARLAPEFKVKKSTAGWKAMTAHFTVPRIPGLVIKEIRHNLRSDVSLELPKAGRAERRLRAAGLLQGVNSDKTGAGTLMIRRDTPEIDPSGDAFEAQRDSIEGSIRTAIELYRWASERAADLAAIIQSAQEDSVTEA